MFWADRLIENLDKSLPQLVNDSKTPSGRAHVGALRGVIIHDVVYRALRQGGFSAKYTFGVDDYDPLDELPYGRDEDFQEFLGKPLCNVPPPPGSHASDMASHYISEFFDVFRYLGVDAQTYRLRDIYRAGSFDQSIDAILSRSDVVREVYRLVSGSNRPETWYPFQVICENCGKIGTTEVYEYDGKEVSYHCRNDLVPWAKGCGYSGKTTPFGGGGKLPWKLEWVAKWYTMGVTVEGAGKDHTTKGGSREVAAECLRRIFGVQPPLNIPYEFFLVEGAKMSSSRGIGVAAGEMADFLPPEILRFLMLKSQPNKPINFSPTESAVTKLFNDFDRCRQLAFLKTGDEVAEIYRLSEVRSSQQYEVPGIQLLQALVQLPHIDVVDEIQKRQERPLGNLDRERLEERIASVQYWIDHYASDSEKLELQQNLPDTAMSLSVAQRAYLNILGLKLQSAEWNEDALQALTFAASRITPISHRDAFIAIYVALFNRNRGPRAGALFQYLDRDFLVRRFLSVSYSKAELWRSTGISTEEFEDWIEREKPLWIFAHSDFLVEDIDESRSRYPWGTYSNGMGVIEFFVLLNDRHVYQKRILFDDFEGIDLDIANEADYFQTYALDYLRDLERRLGISIVSTPDPLRDVTLS